MVGGSEGVGVSVGGGGALRSSKSADVACRSSVFVYKDRAEAKPKLYGRTPKKYHEQFWLENCSWYFLIGFQ